MKQDATKQQEAEARAKSLRDDLTYNTVPGMVRLLEGDVVQLDGGPHIVTRSNQSGATVQPLQKKHVERETLGGKKVEFWAKQRVQHISGCVPKYLILERRGDAGLREFLDSKNLPNRQTPPAAGQSETGGDNQTTESSEVMAAKKKAAAAKKNEEAPKLGALGGWMGYPVTAVLRRLGKEGVTVAHARAIAKANKVDVADATVTIQVGKGRNGQGSEPAALTAAQVKELIGSAPEPVKETKEEGKK